MSPATRIKVRFGLILGALLATGVAAAGYVLVHQRAPVPFRDTYRVAAEFTQADGIVRGIGQPVNVAGVKVGQVVDVKVADGRARVALELERDRVPVVYGNARAVLEPITPLKDMQINIDPGTRAGGSLAGKTIGVDRTSPPVPLTDLLNQLDGDTRTFLSSFLRSLEQGTAGRGNDLRSALKTLGPTVDQTGDISRALTQRRRALARLVHNVSTVATAAVDSGQLRVVISQADRALSAMAEQERPLRSAIDQLPSTLATTRRTLDDLTPFATTLRTSADAVLPAVRKLPKALQDLDRFALTATPTVDKGVRPLSRDAQSLTRKLAASTKQMRAIVPDLDVSLKTTRYFLNELAYNPPGDDEGFLFWLAWFGHNFNSLFSTADAHGAIGRAAKLVTCEGLERQKLLRAVFDVAGACPD